MRIRFAFAISFLILLALSSSLGLLPHSVLPSTPSQVTPYIPPHSDKALHFFDFFALTLTFYFIFDTTRRRVLHITLFVCTLLLGVGSEVVQGLLPNDRDFDYWDVLANVIGSLCAVGLGNAYHRRAAERRRRAKYDAIPTIAADEDVELGEGLGLGLGGITTNGLPHGDLTAGQESGVVSAVPTGPKRTVEEELDNWDENAEDDDAWDEEDDRDHGGVAHNHTRVTPATSTTGSEAQDVTVSVQKMAVD